MDKKQRGYGFEINEKRNAPNASASMRSVGRAPNGDRQTGYGYDPSDIRKHMYASAPNTANGQSRAQRRPSSSGGVHTDAYGRSGRVQSASKGANGRDPRSFSGYGNNGYGDGYYRTENRNVNRSAARVQHADGYHPVKAVRTPDMSANTRAHKRWEDTDPYSREYAYNKNARRVVLTEQQRADYERAYVQKHGTSPYVNRGARQQYTRGANVQLTPPAKEDRRQAFLRDEEIRLRREAEALRAEQQRLREEQEKARRQAAEERRRREAYERREADRRLREAEKRKLEVERHIAYEDNKRKYEAARRAEAEKRRREKRRALERKLRIRRLGRILAFHIRVALVTFLVTAAFVGIFGYCHFWVDDAKYSRRVTYTYGAEKISAVSADTAYCDGVLCVDLIKVAELFGFYTVGDSDRVAFVIPDDVAEQNISVVPGSAYAEINGNPILLSVPARFEEEELWVSAEIMEFFENGVAYSNTKKSVNIRKIISVDEEGEYVEDAEGNYVYEPIILSYKPNSAVESPDLSVIYGDESLGIGLGTMVTFNCELEGFEHYMNPSDSTEYLTLVNKQNLLAKDHIPEGLIDVAGTDVDGEPVQLRLYAAKSLEAMLAELEEVGYGSVKVTQGYLSYQAQVDRFDGYVAEEMAKGHDENEAMRLVLEYCPAPATDEHQSGLAADLCEDGMGEAAFAVSEAYLWLKDNAWKFGFIQRYPDGKDDVTGYDFDPCHYRYVGRYAAEKIYKKGITLEEYLSEN